MRSTCTRSSCCVGPRTRRPCRRSSTCSKARHLAYRAELRRQGKVVANGPFDVQSDVSTRGMSIFACDPAEATRLSDGDLSVKAGRLAMESWSHGVVGRRGTLAFPEAAGPVGERRSMPED